MSRQNNVFRFVSFSKVRTLDLVNAPVADSEARDAGNFYDTFSNELKSHVAI